MLMWEKKRKEKKTKPKIKFLADNNINKHYFLVIINMHH